MRTAGQGFYVDRSFLIWGSDPTCCTVQPTMANPDSFSFPAMPSFMWARHLLISGSHHWLDPFSRCPKGLWGDGSSNLGFNSVGIYLEMGVFLDSAPTFLFLSAVLIW